MKERVLIVLVAVLPFLVAATMTAPYWVPELNVDGGYDAGGVSIDGSGNIWAAGKIYGEIGSAVEAMSTAGASGTVPVSQGDGTLAMEGVYQPGETIPDSDVSDTITVGASGSVNVAALPASVVLDTEVYTGATESTPGVRGLVPDSTAGSLSRFLCVDGTWANPSVGAVTGPGSSTDNAVAVWDGTNGDKIKNSLVLIATGGGVVIPGTLTMGSGAHLLTNSAGLVDGGKLQAGTVTSYQMSATGVTAGQYALPTITVDSAGRVLSAVAGALKIYQLDDGPGSYGSASYVLTMNATGDGWIWEDVLSPTVLPVMVGDSGAGGTQGAVPAPGTGDAAAGKFLNAGGGWSVPTGTGNVSGPASSTTNAFARYADVTGQALANSSISSSDGSSLTVPGTITAGSGAHVLTNSTGLLDGGKLQTGSVVLGAIAQGGATEGQALVWDNTAGTWEPGTVSGSSSLWTDQGDYLYPNNSGEIRLYDGAGSNYVLWLLKEYSGALSNSMTAVPLSLTQTGTIGSGQTVTGIDVYAAAAGGQTGGTGDFVGIETEAGTSAGTADIVGLYGLKAGISSVSGSVVDNAYCVYAAPVSQAGTITNLYGVKVGDVTGGTTNYAIHTGTGDVRFGDDVHIVGNLTIDGTYPGGGSSTFTGLTDTPSSYTGEAGKYVRVNTGATGLEFATVSGGSASPDTLVTWGPLDAEYPATNYATLDTRNEHVVLDFDAGYDEIVLFSGVLPVRYAGGGLTLEVWFAMTSATSGNVVWCAQIERVGEEVQDLDSDGFASAKSVTVAASSTCGYLKKATLTFSSGAEMDSLAAGEAFRVKVYRDANNGSDTATGDAELKHVHLKETAS